jgi:hypothetical protein
MLKLKTFGFWISLLVILAAFMAFQPMTALADPAGITETPTSELPTSTPAVVTETAAPPTPTSSPTPEIPAPVPSATWTVTPNTPPQEPPTPETRKKATAVPLLPVTGEIPPDGPFGGPLTWTILLVGIVIGLVLGLGGRKLLFAYSGKWFARFLSSRR